MRVPLSDRRQAWRVQTRKAGFLAGTMPTMKVHAGVLIAIAALAACDAREPKPKVDGALDLRLIASAWAQQVDQVVPPSAVKGVLAPIDEAFVLFAISNGLAGIEAARLVIK